MIVAAGWLLLRTRSTGNTTNCAGTVPKEQVIVAPLQTCCGTHHLPREFNTVSHESACIAQHVLNQSSCPRRYVSR